MAGVLYVYESVWQKCVTGMYLECRAVVLQVGAIVWQVCGRKAGVG